MGSSIVVFNALQTSLSGGIGRYSYEVAIKLYEYMDKGKLKIVIREEDRELFKDIDIEDLIIAKGISGGKDRNKYEQFTLPRLIRKRYKDAIIHYPDTMAPIFSKNKIIITVHDLAFKSLKDVFTWKTRLWKNFITDESVKKASKIVAITNFTKSEIKRHYGKEIEKKTEVILNGFNDFSKEEINKNNIGDKIKEYVKNDFILTVSTISPRKNIDGLIKAYELLDTDKDLIIAGGYGWLYEDILNLAKNSKKRDKIKFTDKINDDELKELYSKCSYFIYPSFYEGFGLPPLEAMSYEKAVAVSDRTSLKEVVGEKILKFNPDDIKDIERKMETLEKCSSSYIQAAKERVLAFSWDKCAKDLIKIYEELERV